MKDGVPDVLDVLQRYARALVRCDQ